MEDAGRLCLVGVCFMAGGSCWLTGSIAGAEEGTTGSSGGSYEGAMTGSSAGADEGAMTGSSAGADEGATGSTVGAGSTEAEGVS